MKKTFILSITFLIFSLIGRAQNQIDIYESTMKIGAMGIEEYLCGLAEGDQLVFNFEGVNGKELKELEIVELPSTSKFMDYKVTKIENKTISIIKTGIYKFRFNNSAITGRVCKYKIQRIPSSEAAKNFNTSVFWKTVRDTTFYNEDEKYLKSRDTIVVPVIDNQVETVHSMQLLLTGNNKSIVKVTLPENTISWSYYLGVGENAEAIFRQAEEKAQRRKEQLKSAVNIADGVTTLMGGSSVLADLALNGLIEFTVPEKADNAIYSFVRDYTNAQLFMSDRPYMQFIHGDGPLSTRRMDNPLSGTFYICLMNDNSVDAIQVHIRISAVTMKENWDIRRVRKFNVKTWEEPYLKN